MNKQFSRCIDLRKLYSKYVNRNLCNLALVRYVKTHLTCSSLDQADLLYQKLCQKRHTDGFAEPAIYRKRPVTRKKILQRSFRSLCHYLLPNFMYDKY